MKRFASLFFIISAFLVLSYQSSFALQDYYQSDFQGWRDDATDSDFNAVLERIGETAQITVNSDAQFGKVMSPQSPVIMNVTPGLVLQVVVDQIDESSSLGVEVLSAGPPYDGYKIINGITEPGTYNASIGQGTNWKGNKNFWVAIWVEGSGKKATIGKLRIGENIAKVSTPKKESPTKKQEKNKAPGKTATKKTEKKEYKIDFRDMDNYKYFEDWSKGLNGWRDGNTDEGMNTNAEVKKDGRVHLTLKPKTTYGKFMSPEKAIVVDFATHPFLEVDLERELEVGSVKVQLVQARNPENFRVVIPKFSRRGVYIANVPEVAGWRKKEAFYIEVWLEGAVTDVTIKSIGFAKKMTVLQGIMTPIQSLSPEEQMPSKSSDILKVSGAAEQAYRGQWLEGVATSSEWNEMDRYGKKLINIGPSEITQKLYLNASVFPAENIEIYANLGYDYVNIYDNIVWEDIYGATVKAKMSYLMLRYFDFYAGNIGQIGSVYDPLFTDMTLKKTQSFRGFLWKPQIGDFNFKLVGTRMYTDTNGFSDNIFLTAARASNYFTLAPGSVRVGINAVNMSKSNGELDENVFQGKVDNEVYQDYTPALYVKISNNSEHNMYYSSNFDNSVIVTGAGGQVNADFTPPEGSRYVYDQNKTYYDTNNVAQGVNAGGFLVLRVPLKLDQDTLLEPEAISGIVGQFAGGAWASSDGVYRGTIDISISSDGNNWMPIISEAWTPGAPADDGNTYAAYSTSFALTPDQVAEFISGDFDSTEETIARSVLSCDVNGQLFGINIDGEYAVSLAHNQTFRGEHVTHQANAFFVKLSRGIEGALLKAAYFQVMPEYDTSLLSYNMVDDNDNGATLYDLHPDKSGVVFNDYSNRGYPDKEYVVGIYVPEDYLLHEKEDRNHNGLLDSRENDHEPDYTYRRDQKGYDVSLSLPRQIFSGEIISDMEMEFRALSVERISDLKKNQTIDATLNYINTSIENWKFLAGAYVASVKDQISDQYTMYTADDEEIPVTVKYENNFIVTPEVQALYDAPWGLKFSLLNRYRYNKPLHSDLVEEKGNETCVDIRYKHYVLGGFSVMPIYKGRFNSIQANVYSPIHNTYYVPGEIGGQDELEDLPIFHGFYLKNLYPILEEYDLAVDIGREITMHAKRGMADKIYDRLAVGLLRNIPRGYLRVQWELNKIYYPYDNGENWGQSAVWAQFTVSF